LRERENIQETSLNLQMRFEPKISQYENRYTPTLGVKNIFSFKLLSDAASTAKLIWYLTWLEVVNSSDLLRLMGRQCG
jgi:hypothetical protein